MVSYHDKYLTADEDMESVIQGEYQRPQSVWTVELVEYRDAIRLRSCFGMYLIASNIPLLPGVTARKAVQTVSPPSDPAIEWEPLRDGMQGWKWGQGVQAETVGRLARKAVVKERRKIKMDVDFEEENLRSLQIEEDEGPIRPSSRIRRRIRIESEVSRPNTAQLADTPRIRIDGVSVAYRYRIRIRYAIRQQGGLQYCMSKAVERYHRCSYGQTEANQSPNNDQLDTYEEYLKLKERVEALQQSQRHVLGEDLSQLGINELDQLEHILDGTLKQTRSRKNHSLCDKLSDLQQKERSLLELNAALMNKLEGNSAPLESTWQLQHDLNAQYQHPYFLDPNYTPEIRHDSIVAADNVRDNGNEMPLDQGNEAKLIKQVQSVEKTNKSGELIKGSNQAVRQGPLVSRRRAREEMSWMWRTILL
ncbi:hypothetical protein SASPL_133154 [Salvia splendens]|uniref:K-box domain-containing protein n=1 Tax=Salvia splendens TaxID=180675 RepID=A0A8X8X2I0_SALSN|nr:hypothetical protein SASPL_133154 [Salvia splendens]